MTRTSMIRATLGAAMLVASLASSPRPAAAQKLRYGFMDRTGTMVMPVRFDSAAPFRKGVALVKMRGRFGLLFRDGTWAMPPKFTEVLTAPNHGTVIGRTCDRCPWEEVDNVGDTKRSFNGVLSINGFSGGLTVGVVDGMRRIVNDSGRLVFALPTLDCGNIHHVSDGLAQVYADKARTAKADAEARAKAAAAKARAADDSARAGKVRYRYYIVRRAMVTHRSSTTRFGTTTTTEGCTYYVDYGYIDAAPGLDLALVRREFEAPSRMLTLKAGEGVFAAKGSMSDAVGEALRLAGVTKYPADVVSSNFLGSAIK